MPVIYSTSSTPRDDFHEDNFFHTSGENYFYVRKTKPTLNFIIIIFFNNYYIYNIILFNILLLVLSCDTSYTIFQD